MYLPWLFWLSLDMLYHRSVLETANCTQHYSSESVRCLHIGYNRRQIIPHSYITWIKGVQMISCARCYHVLRYMSAINDIFIWPISTVMRLAMISYDYEVQRTSSFLKQVCMGQKMVSSLDGHVIVAYCLFQQATKLVGNQRKSY